MELHGSSYLFTLAVMDITFIGFVAIVIIVRQGRGKELSSFHLLLTRFYMEIGFLSAACAMLPPLLATWGMNEPLIWRLSSVAAVLAIVVGLWTYPSRRRAANGEPVPVRVWINVLVSLLVVIPCVASAAGVWITPGPGPVAAGATFLLYRACHSFESDLVPFFVARD